MKLEGIRVLDLSLFLPGPHLTQVMADHGADVIKVEPANDGEPNRDIGLKRDDISVFFANTHRGKRSVQLNLKSEHGREALLRLAQQTDVMIAAFRPGVVERLGVGYQQVKARSPAIVYCSISAFGQDGPYANKPAHDLATQAYAGILSVNLGPNSEPAVPDLQSADMLFAMMALSGILMALYRRTITGEGDYLDIAMLDCLVGSMPNNLGPVFAENRSPVPAHERSWGGNAMFRIYKTKDDRHLALGGAEMHFAENVLNKLGRPDLIPLCQPPPGPNQDPVKRFFEDTFATKTLAEWMEWFEDINASAAPVNTLREAYDDPQVRARNMVVTDHRGWEHVGIPIKFREEPGQQRFTLPALGEHNEQALAEVGYTPQAIAKARAHGAFRW